jgi:hypothetical protein
MFPTKLLNDKIS